MDAQTHSTDAPASATKPSLYRLLATYWDLYDLFAKAMHATDQIEAGTAEREAAEAAQQKAGSILDEAALAILAYLPTWSIDADIKHDFVSGYARRNGNCLYQPELEALLTSLPMLVDYRGRQKGGAA